MSRLLLLLALTVSLSILGCSDDNSTDPSGDSQNSFRVDGNGYSNLLIETMVDGVASFATEESSGQSTIGTVLMQGASGQDLFTITVAINDPSTGTFTVSQTEGVGLSLNVIKASNPTTPEIYFANGGTITVSEWGGPGGTARGTFEVTAVITPALDKQITVKGSFDLSIRD